MTNRAIKTTKHTTH